MFNLQFETDNAAFEDNSAGEIARILRQLADKIERSGEGLWFDFPVFDINGNKIGLADCQG